MRRHARAERCSTGTPTVTAVIELDNPNRWHRNEIPALATTIAVLVTWDIVGTLPLPLGVAGHEGSTILVALNGLRLLSRRAWPADTGGGSA
ncbi:MAG TPA: cation-transporting ATPase [Gordonia polyisoprenivorans]|uniref:Cation-transporting ATPase n=1 Tax=Gordonia polyisoprenivorans TaxID=84595 RepID=A0A846WRK8_9ACTN|nr:cation-transporting ATPase [Gordonia polyisoprenivorans]NKY04179.1 cation-transporting ATPase [Gordonia polyisoprenivorans]GAB23437.1 putative cation-transporting ATPase [Gordonia polyisoprenivorans NBRC 16320 = JCM 10675]HCS58661.1 cation-transporting ATPase [Gordonia polyisoprenivorans]